MLFLSRDLLITNNDFATEVIIHSEVVQKFFFIPAYVKGRVSYKTLLVKFRFRLSTSSYRFKLERMIAFCINFNKVHYHTCFAYIIYQKK